MDNENTLFQKVKQLYERNPVVHMNVHLKRPTLILEGVEATIVGVYAHIFQIEETHNGVKRRHTLRYTQMLTADIEILEL